MCISKYEANTSTFGSPKLAHSSIKRDEAEIVLSQIRI